ncbi:macrolide export protein MacA [Desulfosporosinus acididurans]|uniref:Macrolide export protein MacA n=1 Tax=Desulfosporosinus acididurans TaxID=476652 RepID=A0A0J1FRA5_9FIRM|nr:efflux RND transporter periplasmic adaptor subunit [Desulfosporosinus acididurans]KLU65852.1 macrolide export protein MacA [Desulfosporosinus acididurans]
MKRRRIDWVISGVLIVAVALVGGNILYNTQNAKADTPSYITGTVRMGTVEKSVSASGTIQPLNQYDLSSGSGGKITEIDVKVGDSVKAGQQLAKLDPSQAQEQLDTAQANLIQAQAKVDQAGSNSANLEAAQLQLSSAQIAYDSAETALADTIIKAPAAGIITAVNGQVGSGSSSGTSSSSQSSSNSTGSQGNSALISMIGTSDTMQVVVPVNQVDIGKVSVGQAANITLDAYQGQTFSGKVTQVSPTGTSQSGVTTFNVTINVTNKDNEMKSGMSANVTIIIAQKQNVLTIPSSAVHTKGSNETVSLLKTGSTVPVTQTIQTGLDDGKNVEVVQGLQAGDKIVLGIRSTSSPTKSQTSQSGNSLNKALGGSTGNFGGYGGGMGGYGGGAGGGRGGYSGGNGGSSSRTQG